VPSVTSNTLGGVVAQAVNDVTSSGALYFSSAGNQGNINDNTAGVWEGDFVDGGDAPTVMGGVWWPGSRPRASVYGPPVSAGAATVTGHEQSNRCCEQESQSISFGPTRSGIKQRL
jgi:hypothetical protein